MTDDIRGESAKEIKPVIRALQGIRRRARVLLVVRRAALVLTGLLLAALILGLTDYFLRLPQSLRIFHWCAGGIVLLLVFWKFLIPALRFRPTLTDLALRIEDSEPRLRGLLASSIDFADRGDVSTSPEKGSLSEGLISMVLRQVKENWPRITLGNAVDRGGAIQATSFFMLAIATAAIVFALSATMWTTGAQRLLWPYGDASWPKRTGVADVTDTSVHPLGTALPLQAALTRRNRPLEDMNVAVRYRFFDGDESAESRRELLTWQGRDVTLADSDGEGALFERLIETTGDGVEYRFETDDDRTEWQRIDLVEPPAVVEATATITPPEYAIAADDNEQPAWTSETTLSLGPGTDERAMAPTALAGSRVSLTVSLNKPLPIPEASRRAIESVDTGASFSGGETDSWTIAWTLNDSVRLPLWLVDEYGIESVDDAVFRFEAAIDRPATATMTRPVTDQNVLATAVVDLMAEGRDDVGLGWIGIERAMARPAPVAPGSEPSGPGGALEPMGETTIIERTEGAGSRQIDVAHQLDLSVLGLRPGDEVSLTALAADVFVDPYGAAREPSRSVIRTLRIIGEEEFIEDIQRLFNDVRQAAMRIEQQQQDVQASTQSRGAAGESRRGQSQVTTRVDRQREAIEQIRESIEQNGLSDPTIDDILESAEAALNRAGESSSDASRQLEDAAARAREEEAESEEADTPLTEDESQAIEQTQEDVRDELLGLVELLDRGEDTFVVRRKLENVMQQQSELREQTRRAGAMTTGRSAEELSQREQSELERIVEKQRELAEQMQELIEEMRERENALSEADPAAAAGMAQAASRAEQQQTPETMQEAAEEAQQNQMTNAGQRQDQAMRDLEQMMEDIEAGNRQRQEILQRMLTSIIESIKGLIDVQESEIEALADAQRIGDYSDRDAAMIALNQNTLGVLDQIKTGGPEFAPVGSLVDKAYDAQVRAITALRKDAVDHEAVTTHEQGSLEMLERALKSAEQIEEQMNNEEAQRRLDELKRAYRDVLEQQVALIEETLPFAEIDQLSRRDRVLVRKLSDSQDAIRSAMSDIREATSEIAEAGVFDYTHTRIDRVMDSATVRLSEADPKGAVQGEQMAARLIRGLIEALDDPESNQEFDQGGNGEGEGGGGGGGGGGEPDLIPPLKELLLLKQLQQAVADATIDLDNAGADASPELIDEIGQSQQELQQLGEDLIKRLSNPGGSGSPIEDMIDQIPDDEEGSDEDPEPAPADPEDPS